MCVFETLRFLYYSNHFMTSSVNRLYRYASAFSFSPTNIDMLLTDEQQCTIAFIVHLWVPVWLLYVTTELTGK